MKLLANLDFRITSIRDLIRGELNPLERRAEINKRRMQALLGGAPSSSQTSFGQTDTRSQSVQATESLNETVELKSESEFDDEVEPDESEEPTLEENIEVRRSEAVGDELATEANSLASAFETVLIKQNVVEGVRPNKSRSRFLISELVEEPTEAPRSDVTPPPMSSAAEEKQAQKRQVCSIKRRHN
jgi:hypothetical protein